MVVTDLLLPGPSTDAERRIRRELRRLKKLAGAHPESLTVRLPSAGVEALAASTASYQTVHHQALDKRTLLLEIGHAFVAGVRAFRS